MTCTGEAWIYIRAQHASEFENYMTVHGIFRRSGQFCWKGATGVLDCTHGGA